MRVRSWLRMNAGGVLNTCKSSGDCLIEDFGWKLSDLSGGRVSNAWRTCTVLGDSSWKRLVIPHETTGGHPPEAKDLSVQDGSAFD